MLFNTRRFFVCMSLLLSIVLAGCEEAPDDDTNTNPKFYLISPIAGDEVLDLDENLRIIYKGDVNAETISIVLNGVDIKYLMNPSDATGSAKTDLASLKNILILGQNILVVSAEVPSPNPSKPAKQFSKTFTFFFDDKIPHVEITRVTPSAIDTDSRPAQGSTLTIEGNIVDISDIRALQFNYPGGNVYVRPTLDATPGVNEFTNVLNAQGNRTFIAEVQNYPDITVPTSSPHFSYTVSDVHDQTRTEEFLASGAMLSRKMALQVNDGFLDNFNPLVNGIINWGLSEIQNRFGIEELLALTARGGAAFTEVITNLPNTTEYAPERVLATAGRGEDFCSSLILNLQLGDYCVVYLRDVAISGLGVDTQLWDSNDLLPGGKSNISMHLNADEVRLYVELSVINNISGISRYRGGITSNFGLFHFPTTIAVQLDTDPEYRMGIKRISDFIIGVERGPDWYGGKCIGEPICRDSAFLAWANVFYALGMDVFNFQAILDGNSDVPNPNGTSDIKEIVPIIEAKLNAQLLPWFDELLTDNPAVDNDISLFKMPERSHADGLLDELSTTYIGPVLGQNAHTLSQGRYFTIPSSYDPLYRAVGGGLGSSFQAQGCYVTKLIGSACGNSFQEQLNHYEPMDLVFSIPSNAFNQFILTKYQMGNLDDFEMTTPGEDFIEALPEDISELDTATVTFSFGQEPILDFTPNVNVGLHGCLDIFGFKPCNRSSTMGSIKVIANNLDVSVANSASPSVSLMQANIDLEFEVYISGDGVAPLVAMVDNSIVVRLNRISSEMDETPGLVSDSISSAVVSYLRSDDLKDEVKSIFETWFLNVWGDVMGVDLVSGFNEQTSSLNVLSIWPDPVTIPQSLVEGLTGGSGASSGFALSFPVDTILGQSIPREYGVTVRQFQIEENGSYIQVGVDLHNSVSGWTPEQQEINYLNFVLEAQ